MSKSNQGGEIYVHEIVGLDWALSLGLGIIIIL